MKKKLFTFLFLTSFGFSFSQDADLSLDDCMARFSTYYHQNYKNKNYAEAYPSWYISFHQCIDKYDDKYKSTIIFHGKNILNDRVKKSKTEDEKKNALKELFDYYEIVINKFPEYKSEYISYKGEDMFKYAIDYNRSYQVLKDAIVNNDANGIVTLDAFFKNSVYLFNKKELTDVDVFSDYDIIMEKIEKITDDLLKQFNLLEKDSTVENAANILDEVIEKDKKKAENLVKQNESLNKLASNIDNLIAPIATQEKIIKLYTAKFNENKNNQNWLKSALSMLARKKCFKDPIYRKVAEAYHQINPTYKSAKSLGLMSLMNDDWNLAYTYYKQSLTFASSDEEKADSYVNMAKSLSSSSTSSKKAEGRKCANEALKLVPNLGSAYLAIGMLYIESANDCGNNIFEKKAVYWAALEQLRKAKQNAENGETRTRAEFLIKNYSSQTPDKELVFQYGFLDKSYYTIGCWINETVKIPKF